MRQITTDIADVFLLEPDAYNDKRGFFLENYSEKRYAEFGIPTHFVQDNHSRSTKHCLRGLHYQQGKPQGKLVSVSRGRVFDVAVDLRRDSATFTQAVCAVLDDENHRQLYIPPGFAHGFCVLSDEADFLYKCTEYYEPNLEAGIAWNDPDINIRWPIEQPLLSDKDKQHPTLSELLEGP